MIGYKVIFLWDNLSLLLLNNLNTTMHKHYSLEIYISLDSHFMMDFGKGFCKYDSLIVNSNVPHRFSGNNGTYALILINPYHNQANYLLKNILNGNNFKEFDFTACKDIFCKLSNTHKEPLTYDSGKELIDKLLKFMTNDHSNKNSIDLRIEKVISLINCSIKEPIRVASLAYSTNLSESRIRHLFKKETGVTIRQYILHMRLIEAIKLVINGFTKTNAAHEAGFSDSAHLSRTFKNIYGLTLSDLYKNNCNEKIQCSL